MTKMKKFLMLLTVAAIALVCLTGCSSVNITSIGLPTDMQLEKGETAQLEISYGADKENAKADAIAKAAEGLALVWESDNEDVATVDENGLVTAVGGGEANITVSIKDANIQSVCKITVDVALEDIEAPEDMALVINGEDTAKLEVKLLPEDATDVELAFESSDENVATVDADGKVTAVANGECVVTVSCGDIKAETAVKVDTAPVELKAEDMEIMAGKTAQVDVVTEGEDITVGMEYSYTSGDEKIATVDENGVVTGVAAGETTITVENELGQEITCNVVVKEAPKQTTTRPFGNNGNTGNAGNGGAGATAPTQPSGGNGGGSTPASTPDPTPAPQPDPTPAPVPDPTPDVPPSGGAAGGSIGDIIPGGGTSEGNGGDATPGDEIIPPEP